MNAPIGFDGKPLKATKYAIDEHGVEHIMWEKELPPGWRRKYVSASNWQGFMDCLEKEKICPWGSPGWYIFGIHVLGVSCSIAERRCSNNEATAISRTAGTGGRAED